MQERFTMPKASCAVSKNSSPVYGLPEKSSLRVSKHEFERQKALESDQDQQRCGAVFLPACA